MKQSRLGLGLLSLCLLMASTNAQNPNTVCVASAKPPIVRSEGITERIGEITLDCSGQPGTQLSVNLTISLNANVTNRISSGNQLTGIIFTIDSGTGPQAVTVVPMLASPNTLAYNGVNFTLSAAKGTAILSFANIRANATQVGLNVPLTAFVQVNGSAALALTTSTLTVGNPQRGLFSSQSSRLVCSPNGSPLPDTITYSSVIASGAVFASTRVTEGFADALQPSGLFVNGYANLNADSGHRILVRYSGFPQGARLFVPDVVAGSDAATPTAGGDFGLAASGGAYTPSATGSLLLARVSGADPNGIGGGPVFSPVMSGPGTVQFDKVSELQLVNGGAYAVYEVVDVDPNRLETAQFPTFLGLPPTSGGNAVFTSETVSFAPVSTVSIATRSDPIPRFVFTTPGPDCSLVGDCSASYLPRLSVQTYNSYPGNGPDPNTLLIRNDGAGVLQWSVTAAYPQGLPSGWLTISPAQGVNNATVRITANPANLQPGTYRATLTVDAGPLAGAQVLPVTFTVAPAPPPAAQVIVNVVVNAASFASVPVVPGSLVSIMGSAFTGKLIAVTFDGQPGTILFSNDTQINVLVPAGLTSNQSKIIVTVDGVSSSPKTVDVAAFAPAIFKGAVLNRDWTVNSATKPAAMGSIVQIYATGLSGNGTITATIGGRVIAAPSYAGPAPGFLGVQQVNLQVPSDLAAMTTEVSVCGASVENPDAPVCSIPAPLTVQ